MDGKQPSQGIKKDLTQLKQITENIMKRFVMALKSTPWEPLYLETGILTPEAIVLKNRTNYNMDKLKENQSSILKNIREDQDQKGWRETNNKTREEQGIPPPAPFLQEIE